MKMLILNTEMKTELEAANYSGDPARQLMPANLLDNRFGLNADLLQDCGQGQTWEHYREFLTALPDEEVASVPVFNIA